MPWRKTAETHLPEKCVVWTYVQFLKDHGFQFDDPFYRKELPFNMQEWLSTCMVLRMLWEHTNIVEWWYKWTVLWKGQLTSLLGKEADPWLVFILAHMTCENRNSNHTLFGGVWPSVVRNPRTILAELREVVHDRIHIVGGNHACWNGGIPKYDPDAPVYEKYKVMDEKIVSLYNKLEGLCEANYSSAGKG